MMALHFNSEKMSGAYEAFLKVRYLHDRAKAMKKAL